MSRQSVVLITGSRKWWLHEPIQRVLEGCDLVIHGGASGADAIAREYAWRHDLDEHCSRAKHNRWPQAGPERNTRMVRVARALMLSGEYDVVCHAFPLPDSKGTRDCIRKAMAAGLEVIVHELEVESP